MSKGKNDDYEIGYKKPPKKHRFKKGQPSPNPGGRPKGKKSFPSHYRKLFCETKWPTQSGEELTGEEMALLKLLEGVNKGNMRAISKVIEMAQEHSPEDLQIIPPFVPSKQELAEFYKDELEEDGKDK